MNLLIAAMAAVPVQAKTLDGDMVQGDLRSLSAINLVLSADNGEQQIPIERLVSLAIDGNGTPASGAPSTIVQLRDGSLLPVSLFGSARGSVHLKIAGQSTDTAELPIKSIRAVQFLAGENDAQFLQQWESILDSKAAGDLLVVRKDEALDYLEGVIREVDDDVCHFELDGESIPVKRAKIAGLVYAASSAELPEAIGTLHTPAGLRLEIQSLSLEGDVIRLITPAGTTHELTLPGAMRLDFSSGKIVYLSDLEPENLKFTPLVPFARPPHALLEYYNVRRDVGFDQGPLRLNGEVFRKGLALTTRTELEYRLPGKFSRFRVTAGIDEATRATGSVYLTIRGDQRELWSGEVVGTQPPQSLELDVSGVRRLSIVADYGQGLDIGDRLILAEAELSK